MPDVTFQLTLFGDLRLATFSQITNRLQRALQEIEQNVTHEQPHADWSLDATQLPVMASPNGVSEETLRQVVQDAYDGFAQAYVTGAGREAPLPPTLGAISQGLIDFLLSRLGNELERITVEASDREELSLDIPLAMDTLPAVASPTYDMVSTISGVVEFISIRGDRGPHFSLREHWSRRLVTCYVTSDLLPTIGAAIGKRVEVTGLVRFRENDQPWEVRDISDFDELPDRVEDVMMFEGAVPNLTGGLDAEEYVRQLRSGEHAG